MGDVISDFVVSDVQVDGVMGFDFSDVDMMVIGSCGDLVNLLLKIGDVVFVLVVVDFISSVIFISVDGNIEVVVKVGVDDFIVIGDVVFGFNLDDVVEIGGLVMIDGQVLVLLVVMVSIVVGVVGSGEIWVVVGVEQVVGIDIDMVLGDVIMIGDLVMIIVFVQVDVDVFVVVNQGDVIVEVGDFSDVVVGFNNVFFMVVMGFVVNEIVFIGVVGIIDVDSVVVGDVDVVSIEGVVMVNVVIVVNIGVNIMVVMIGDSGVFIGVV